MPTWKRAACRRRSRPERAGEKRGRAADRDAGIQFLDSRRAEERDRLAVASAARCRAGAQAGRDRRRRRAARDRRARSITCARCAAASACCPVPRPELFVLNAWEKFDADGRLKDELTVKQVGELLAALARLDLAAAQRARVSAHDRSLLLADLERAQDHHHAARGGAALHDHSGELQNRRAVRAGLSGDQSEQQDPGDRRP